MESLLKGTLEAMKDRFVDRLPAFQVLDDDSLQQRRRYIGVPNALRIDDDNRSVAADTEARRLASLHARRTEEQVFPRQKLGEQRIKLSPAAIGRTEVTSAHQHMAGVRLHLRLFSVTHSKKIHLLTSTHTCTAVSSV